MSDSSNGFVKFPKVLQIIRSEDSGRRRDSAQNVMQDLVLTWGTKGSSAGKKAEAVTTEPEIEDKRLKKIEREIGPLSQ